MVLALAELIAAWNCELQSEKAMVAAADGLADAPALDEPVAEEVPGVEVVVLAGEVARLAEVQAALTSTATAATSTDSRVARRWGSIP
jgi:hypothetical protein